MEPSPANHRAAKSHKSLMDVIPLVESRPEASELMEQSQRLLHDIAEEEKAHLATLGTLMEARA